MVTANIIAAPRRKRSGIPAPLTPKVTSEKFLEGYYFGKSLELLG